MVDKFPTTTVTKNGFEWRKFGIGGGVNWGQLL